MVAREEFVAVHVVEVEQPAPRHAVLRPVRLG